MQSVVVRFDSALLSIDGARQQLHEHLDSAPKNDTHAESALIEIPVCYGGEYGPDFDSICQMLTLTADELIEIHTETEYRIEMLGFTPGFAYVGGLSAELNVPRLAEPRQRVAAGSIGITDGLTGLYALAGPGGWPLVGRTPVPLFEAGSEQPFVLRELACYTRGTADNDSGRTPNRHASSWSTGKWTGRSAVNGAGQPPCWQSGDVSGA
jgi:KipI family sensor histidine kinase inhibitor